MSREATVAVVWLRVQAAAIGCLLTLAVGPAAVVSEEARAAYITYVLEEHCRAVDTVIPVYMPPWSALLVTFGQSEDAEYFGRDKHTCTIKVTTDKGFHIGGVVESIRIQGEQHPSTKRWECEDYIRFRTKGIGLVNQVLDMLLPDYLFKGRQSEKLCGERHLDTSKIFRMVDTSSHSNVFSTMANSMELEYHQDEDLKTPVNNSFTVVISNFRNINENECAGDDQVLCGGGGGTSATRTEKLYCIHARYVCDGHVNCALPGGGSDERGCPGGEVAGLAQYSAVFSSTIIIFIALGSIVGAMVLLVILYTLVARARGDSNRSSPVGSTTAVNYSAGAEAGDVVPATRRHRRRHHHHHHHHRHDSIGEEEEEEGSRRSNRTRSGGRCRGRREGLGRPVTRSASGSVIGEIRRQNTLQGYDSQSQLQTEDKSQVNQPIAQVNQYNSFTRVNSNLSNHLTPSAPDIQPYPPSYDILFPTDG